MILRALLADGIRILQWQEGGDVWRLFLWRDYPFESISDKPMTESLGVYRLARQTAPISEIQKAMQPLVMRLVLILLILLILFMYLGGTVILRKWQI